MMASHTIKVTGVSEELLQLLDQRIRMQHAAGRAEYIRELIRRDVLNGSKGHAPAGRRSFRELLAPVHDATPPEETEEETEQFVDDLIATVRRERRERRAQSFSEAAE